MTLLVNEMAYYRPILFAYDHWILNDCLKNNGLRSKLQFLNSVTCTTVFINKIHLKWNAIPVIQNHQFNISWKFQHTRILNSPRLGELSIWRDRFTFSDGNIFHERHLWWLESWLVIFKVRAYCSLQVPTIFNISVTKKSSYKQSTKSMCEKQCILIDLS